MTTIATDGKSIAGDGLGTYRGSIISRSDEKVVRLSDGRLIGCCGSREDGIAVVAWLNGEAQEPEVGDDFGALLLNLDGSARWMASKLKQCACDLPAAMGSGMEFAVTAMLCGKSPREAVEMAAALDTHTGGKITVLHLETQP